MKITLRNDFHNTSTTAFAPVLNHGMRFETSLTRSQMKRIAKKLCGIDGCTCSGAMGVRGPQAIGSKRLIVSLFPRN